MKTIEEIRRENLQRLVDETESGKQAELARKTGVDSTMISNFINARRNMGSDVARTIEQGAGKTRGWMDHEHAVSEPSTPYVVTRQVPIVGTTQAGPDKEWLELGYPAGCGDAYIDAPASDERAYALYVRGNSMAPRMLEGEAILIYPSREPQPGDEVVLRLRSGDTMVKRLTYVRDSRAALDSISPDYQRIIVDCEQIEFMHLVVGVIRAGAIRYREE